MLEQKHQAIQASVALALIWSVTLLISIAVLGFSLAGEWQRALNASSAGLIILPACFVLHRQLRRGKGRQVLLAITLLTWMVSTLLLFRAGTIVNPNTAVLVGLSITGSLAHDRLLARLIPCLSLLSISAVYLLVDNGLLSQGLPPSELGLLLGCVMAVAYLVVLARLSGRNLAQALQSDQEKTQQLELAMTAGSLCCFNFDARTGCVLVNEDSCELLDLPVGEHLLRNLAVFSQSDVQKMQQGLMQTLQGTPFPSLDLQLQGGIGSGKWFRLFMTASAGARRRLICVMQDIDEQKRTELLKENFTAMVSHELRTPLTALLGAMGLLQGLHFQNMNKDAQGLLDLAIRGGERLSRLVNDILEFFKLQSGELPVTCQLQPLKPMVEQALDSVQSLLQASELTVQLVGLEDDVSAQLDSERAQQVLINVLANAIRFSPQGSVLWLTASCTAEHVRLNVRDSGPGISQSFQSQMFKPFAQASTGNTRDNNSTGLGLSISRGLMRRMGGELSFSSPAGEGATFHLDFAANS